MDKPLRREDREDPRVPKVRGRRVYGGSGGAKSTKGNGYFALESVEIAILRNP